MSFKVQGRISQEVLEYFIRETMDGIIKKGKEKKKIEQLRSCNLATAFSLHNERIVQDELKNILNSKNIPNVIPAN